MNIIMLLHRLALANFRNYVRLGLELADGPSVFLGDNGQGKSNLLEAVYFLATTRSFRSSNERELVRWGAREDSVPFARIDAHVRRADAEPHIDIVLRGENGAEQGASLAKTIKVNGLPRRAVELVGEVNVVLFSPEDLALVSGPPAGRRRYLDITNSQLNPRYLRTLQRYNRVLLQRNQLLRHLRERGTGGSTLEMWDEELLAGGAYLMAVRLQMLRAIEPHLAEIHRGLSGSLDTLQIVYHWSGESEAAGANGRPLPPPEPSLESCRALLARALAVARPKELAQAVSLVGPHRDDLVFLRQGVDLQTYGSRGQQRLAALALKLAEVAYMTEQRGERPILLLDDVLSELDPQRRRFVQRAVRGEGQTLITSADAEALDPAFLRGAATFRVEHGTIRPGPTLLDLVREPAGDYTAHTGEDPSDDDGNE